MGQKCILSHAPVTSSESLQIFLALASWDLEFPRKGGDSSNACCKGISFRSRFLSTDIFLRPIIHQVQLYLTRSKKSSPAQRRGWGPTKGTVAKRKDLKPAMALQALELNTLVFDR